MASNESHDSDIIYLLVDGEKFECLKSRLSEKSDYFQAMFQSQMKESRSNEIDLKGINSESFRLLLQFMNTGDLDLTKDNVSQLTEASCMFQVTTAIQHCVIYLTTNINHDNCISIMNLSETFSLNNIYNRARRHLLWYFLEVCKNQEFLHLEKGCVIDILAQKTLNVESELVVYNAVENWILFDKANRNCLFFDLMNYVHIEDFSSEELEMFHSQVKLNFPDFLEHVLNTTTKRDFNQTQKKFRHISYTVISVGGEIPGEDRSTPFQELLRFDVNKFIFEHESIADLSEIHRSPGIDIGYRVCSKGKDIIFTGGEVKLGKNTWIVDVWKYDMFTGQWEILTQLPNVRRHHGMCVMEDSIFLIGGFGKYRMKLSSVEMFNCKTGEWRTLASLPEPSFSISATVCNGKIYAVKSRVYCYDLEKDEWKIVNGDPPPFICSDAVTYADDIYLPSRYCSRLMRFDTKSCAFEEVGNFPHSKAAGSSTICDGKIFRVGISDFKVFMEWYDIDKNEFGSTEELDLFMLNNHLVSVPFIKEFI